MNAKEQEAQLKLNPDIVVATPGRLIDLADTFSLSAVEVLVLDEADRSEELTVVFNDFICM